MAVTSQVLPFVLWFLSEALRAFLGTSACLGNTFYCANEGHIGASIPSSHVNDGLCGQLSVLCYHSSIDASLEPACCDGSDEPVGVCENMCVTVGEIYRKKQEAARKLQSTVSIPIGPASHTSHYICRVPKSVRHILPSHGKRRNG